MPNTAASRLTAAGAVLAVAVSGASLAISLLHGGPVGPPGPQGVSGAPAVATDTRHLGYCVTIDGNTNMWVSDISAPVIVGGVQQCTSGTFVPLTARKESP